jgi:hypothetical protein
MVRFGFIFLSQSVESQHEANRKFNERFSLYEDF